MQTTDEHGSGALRPKHPAIVPYIAPWTRETVIEPQVLIDPDAGFTYEDALPTDRDAFGALWRRQSIVSGDRGNPRLGDVHSRRQRRCMTRLLCQVCAGPASRTSEGVLFLDQDHREDWSTWPETLGTVHPPVCLPCAAESVRRCRHLIKSWVAIRARTPVPWGVYGIKYSLGPDRRLQADGKVEMEYGDPLMGWVVASQMIVRLDDCTIVDLDRELAALT